VHVALRTVRTVAEVERVTPAQRVDWAMRPEAASGIKWTVDTQTLVNQGRHITVDADAAAATGGGGGQAATAGQAMWQKMLHKSDNVLDPSTKKARDKSEKRAKKEKEVRL